MLSLVYSALGTEGTLSLPITFSELCTLVALWLFPSCLFVSSAS